MSANLGAWIMVVIVAVLGTLTGTLHAQLMNRAPSFVPGSGDMSRFSLSENTPVGGPVYQLRGIDPEGSALRYSISGPVFSVDRATGVVRLRQELDRETQDLVEVIISLTDEGVLGTEPNTVSLRREIPIRDFNDNAPVFVGRPYSAVISEATTVGSAVAIMPTIIVTDKDEGQNADVHLSCSTDGSIDVEDTCDYFTVTTDKIAEGNFSAAITLAKQLDFETRPSFILTIQARDGATTNVALTALATVAISVLDIQDQPPVFSNAPYSATVQENTPGDTSILTISATDGDTGNPRPIFLSLENLPKKHFKLQPIGPAEDGKAILLTTDIPLDRESADVLQNGGVFSFEVRATELINNEVPGDSTVTQVTIVLTDVDDHQPHFNQDTFNISITENLEYDTPLPGLAIFAIDEDLGVNSRYNLSLVNVRNADDVFTVSPTFGEGRTPIVVKVVDAARLDFDVADARLRVLEFEIVASVDGKRQASSAVTVNLLDANDNSPEFSRQNYNLVVREDAERGFKIADIAATDRDMGSYGQLHYVLKGFGADLFATNKTDGGMYVLKPLDFEQQKSYSLTLVAIDGGGRETNANLYVEVLDVNDNRPMFELLEYTRTIREGAVEFEPQFFVRATDVDGPAQGGGRISYAIESENSISGHVFSVNVDSGEISIQRAVNSMDTERGQYELIVTATDHGEPPLKNDTRVLIRVGISGNQRPIFKGHFQSSASIPGPPSYRVSIPENSVAGTNVTTVSATDPDGIDSLLQYRIVGERDNFVIDDRSGLVTVSTEARLDRDTNPESYAVIVNAIDAGFPIPETATATIYVKIDDVNDKPPKFTQPAFTAYVSERADPGAEVLVIQATDTDLSANLEYSIIEPIRATSKTGVQLTSTVAYDYRAAFRVEPHSGRVLVNSSLDYNAASVIMLTVKVRDRNATVNVDTQFAIAEATFYVQAFKDTNPMFRNTGWTSTRPTISRRVKEEMPIGSTLFTLVADDPVDGVAISHFEILMADDGEFIGLNERTGEMILKKRLDYETLNETVIEFTVKAVSANGDRETVTNVNITVENVNDNDPIFERKMYRATVLESAKYPDKLITVHANDKDAVLTELDRRLGFSTIAYSLSGTNAGLFTIDNTTGEIRVGFNQTVDRELFAMIRLLVIAEDAAGKPSDSRKTSVELLIDVLDVNDNPPKFVAKKLTAVIPENSPVDSLVLVAAASDPDEGPGGEVRYDFLNEGDANGLLKMNTMTGEIRTKLPLTGKGRPEPYELVVRAQDNGNQIAKQRSLHSDITFVLYIGDVSANDGIPFFVAPKIGQIANVSENATIGSPVFQVTASDPDSPGTPSGMLQFRIQDDIEDAKTFKIDAKTGLVTTLKPLDRETKSSYNVIIEVADKGQPPQASTRVLRINVIDIDDHRPRFIREIDAQPLEMHVLEEQPIGAIVGNLSAIDEDIGENGAIDYMFTDGNHEDFFKITRTDTNAAVISTAQRLDRETFDSFLVTVKCFKNGTAHAQVPRRGFNSFDDSEIRVLIRLIDIDDHLPAFHPQGQTVGVRLNTPVDTSIITIRATDEDRDGLPIVYSIQNISFIAQFYKRNNNSVDLSNIFTLNNRTGEIRTVSSLADFVDGYFEVLTRASNSHVPTRFTENLIKIFVIRDKSLLRFVFTRPAAEMRNMIEDFKGKVRGKLMHNELEMHVFDAQVLIRPDLSLDFSSTSSCFQLTRHGAALAPHDMQKIMDSNEIKNALLPLYAEFYVTNVDSCSVSRSVASARTIASPGTWLVILAGAIGVAALILTCSACCLFKKYKQNTRRIIAPRIPAEPYVIGNPVMYTETIYSP